MATSATPAVLGMLMLCCGSLLISLSGCALIPQTRVRDTIHNPFPQLKTVAILPFYNQSETPTLNTREVAQAYYAAVQSVPGFEVVPVGVTELQLRQYATQYGMPTRGEDFQRLATMMDVEAIVVGSVTDFEAYYPPRMAMTVRWYAANEGFHEIPAGYGLPWGTDKENDIPARIVREAEFELARSQLKTQTPQMNLVEKTPDGAMPIDPLTPKQMESNLPMLQEDFTNDEASVLNPLRDPFEPPAQIARMDFESDVASQQIVVPHLTPEASRLTPEASTCPSANGDCGPSDSLPIDSQMMVHQDPFMMDDLAAVPPNWPDPTDLIPDPPSPSPPAIIHNHDPVLSHTRLYRGDDPYFTARLADYVETGDDARGASWQGYLRRSEDFIRFCCHLHLIEMLEARGGRDPSDLILQWPVSRY
ncbi:MAG: hypothetical protein AAF745_00355 [Planctomycetota bacterium]